MEIKENKRIKRIKGKQGMIMYSSIILLSWLGSLTYVIHLAVSTGSNDVDDQQNTTSSHHFLKG